MTDYRLLKTQKNEVLLLIQEAGFSPIEFGFEECTEEEEDALGAPIELHFHRLVHQPSNYALLFGKGFVTYSPGANTQESWEARPNWSGMLDSVQRWLGYLKREVEAPDLWAALAEEQELLGAEPAEAVNTPFNAEEQVQVKRAIEEIRVYITATHTLEAEPLAEINRKLDYLIDASTRLGRKDWKIICVGILVTLAIPQLTPSGPGVRELFAIAWHLLRHVLGSVISPPLLH